MTKMKALRRGVVIAAAGTMAWFVASQQGRAQGPSNSSAGPIDPGLFKNVYYRPLTVFSRGGRVTAVAGVPSNPQLYYLGSAGGVFKTEDAGATWSPITDGQLAAGSIGATAVADSH